MKVIFLLVIMQSDGHVPNWYPPKYDTLERCQAAGKALMKGTWYKNYSSFYGNTAESNLQATCIEAME